MLHRARMCYRDASWIEHLEWLRSSSSYHLAPVYSMQILCTCAVRVHTVHCMPVPVYLCVSADVCLCIETVVSALNVVARKTITCMFLPVSDCAADIILEILSV